MSDDPSLEAFLSQVALVANIDTWQDKTNAVSLMTLHNAKGLEFTVVMIPGLEDGLLPHESSFDDDEELEEERRLFYVGMTRAIDELHFYAADTRRRGGLVDVRTSSRFVDEIGASHLEVRSVEIGPRTWAGRGRAARVRGGDVFPDYESYSQEDTLLTPGTRVAHAAWGEGVVVEISGVGLDAVVRVRFDGDTEKRIMVRYGKLEILTD
jgi:DNA helicase-2/ATP-dependent DNA helicase PcrA